MNEKSFAVARQHLFYQNLLVLGFDPVTMAKEHNTTFDWKMFSLPNQKAFEVVTHFLFSKLNDVSEKKYSILFPIFDTKQRRQFQKACFTYLSSIAQESSIKFPFVSHSVLSSYGDTFYELYFAFSTHVVLKTNENFGISMLQRPSNRLHQSAVEMLQIATISSVKTFEEAVEISSFHIENYFKIAKNLMENIEQLKQSNVSNQYLFEEKFKDAFALFAKEGDSIQNISLEDIVCKSKEYQEKVNQFWKSLEDFIVTEKFSWNCLASELNEKKLKPSLNGKDYIVSIPDVLKEEYSKEFEKEIKNKKKSLCILRFLKILTLTLEFYITSMKKGNFSQSYSNSFLKYISELEDYTKMVHSVSEELERINIQSMKNIEEFLENINLDEVKQDMTEILSELPPSPKARRNSSTQHLDPFSLFAATQFDEKTWENLFKDQYNREANVTNKSERLNSNCLEIQSQIFWDTSSNIQSDSRFSSEEKFPFSLNEDTSSSPVSKLNSRFTLETGEATSPNVFYTPETSSYKKNLFLKSSTGTAFDFDIPQSWLLEESLNAQTLSEESSIFD